MRAGCSYCFARPSDAYLNLSPGLDFETRLFAKVNAPELLRRELSRPGYVPSAIALGINTDAYQPIERKLQITRRMIEGLRETRHPFTLITENALVTRDLDLLQPLAQENLVSVYFSVTTLDPHLSAKLEPRAAAPHARLRAMAELHEAGVPVGVMAAPVIPWINDHELEAILRGPPGPARVRPAIRLLRLPHEVAPLFRDWLQARYPDRAAHCPWRSSINCAAARITTAASASASVARACMRTCWRGVSNWPRAGSGFNPRGEDTRAGYHPLPQAGARRQRHDRPPPQGELF